MLFSYASVPLRHLAVLLGDGMAHLFWLHEHLEHTHHHDHDHLEHELEELAEEQNHEHEHSTAPTSVSVKDELSKHIVQVQQQVATQQILHVAYRHFIPIIWKNPTINKLILPPRTT